MVKTHDQTLNPRGYTDGTQADENVLSSVNWQRNRGKPWHITTHLSEWLQSNSVTTPNVHEDTKKLNYSCTDDGNVKCSNHSRKQLKNFLKELSIELQLIQQVLSLSFSSETWKSVFTQRPVDDCSLQPYSWQPQTGNNVCGLQ